MFHISYLRLATLFMSWAIFVEGLNVLTGQPTFLPVQDNNNKEPGEQRQSLDLDGEKSEGSIFNNLKLTSAISNKLSTIDQHRKREVQEQETAHDLGLASTGRQSNTRGHYQRQHSSPINPKVSLNQPVTYDDLCKLESSGPKQFIYRDKFLCKPCKCYQQCDNSIVAMCEYSTTIDRINISLKPDTRYLTISMSRMTRFTADDFLKYQNLTSLAIVRNYQLNRIVNSSLNGQLAMLTSLNFSTNKINLIDDRSFIRMPNLLNLTLCHNLINHITSFTFEGLDNLQILNLSLNVIVFIESGAFRNFLDLRILDLSRNRWLGYKPPFTSEFFRNIQSLREFYIYGNYRPKQNFSIIDFGQLTNLTLLHIDGTDMNPPFGTDIKMLQNLTTLHLGFISKDTCNLQTITTSFFENLPYLETIRITRCPLTKVDFNAFKIPLYLRKLELITIKTYTILVALNGLEKLQNSSLKSLSFVGMVNMLHSIVLTGKHAKFLKNIPLDELNLSENGVTEILPDFILNLPTTLKRLILRQNRLVDDSFYLNYLNYLHNLVTLDFSMDSKLGSKKITNCSRNVGDENNEFLKYNRYSDATEYQEYIDTEEDNDSFSCLRIGHQNHVNSNKEIEVGIASNLTEFDSNVFNGDTTTIFSEHNIKTTAEPAIIHSIPRSLQYLIAHRYLNMVVGQVLAVIRRPVRNNLTYIDFSECFIEFFDSKVTIAPNVQILNLGGNYMQQFPCHLFMISNNSLRYLSLNNNLLGQFFLINNGTLFQKLSNVHYLDISMNMIFELPRNFFQGLQNVNILNMKKNKLQVLDINFSLMPSLRYVDLKKNSISWITKSTRDELDIIGASHDLYIDLSSNPLRCTCEGLEVLHWIWSSNIYFVSKDFLRCLREDGSADDVGKIDDRVRTLQRYCAGKSIIIVICVASLVFTFILVGFGLIYRFRWQLRYIRNIALSRFLGFKPRKFAHASYKFDAYVLYSETSRKFVISKCLPELEMKRGHKLCFDDRDFWPGTLAISAIVSAIQNSRKTLLIVAPDFYDEEYSEYAVKMAIMEEIYAKRNVLHLCMYQPITDNELSRCQDLLMILRRNDYTECPPEEQTSTAMFTSFWDQMSEIIGRTPKQEEVVIAGDLNDNVNVTGSVSEITRQETFE